VTNDESTRLRAVVRGRVQGVSFRFFVQARALQLGLTGYVRNLSDGRSVEVVAEGTQAALDLLVTSLREGPPMSHVEGVDLSCLTASGEYAGFVIR
jgi:acylphosphatase